MEDEAVGGELVPERREERRIGDLKPIPEQVRPECRELAESLRELFGAIGVSLRVFALRVHYDAGTVSRYLNGTVVPPAEFVDQLLTHAAKATGRPSSAEVMAHVHTLQRRALQATNKVGWELQNLRDQLAAADRQRQQAEIRAEALTEALQVRKQRIAEMEVEQRRLAVSVSAERDARDVEMERLRGEREDLRTERDRLREEVSRLQHELTQARRQALEAEQRCEELEHQLQAGEEAAAGVAADDPGHDRVPDIWDGVPRRNPRFTGRDDLLPHLRARLEAAPAEAAVCALAGMPGIGKTQLAAEYVHRYGSEYGVVWWIAVDGRPALRERLAALAPALGLDVGPETGERIRAVLDALRRGRPYDRWLLVLDGAEDPDDIAGLLPSGRGHLLVTSQNHAWRDHYAELLEVPPLSPRESVVLVRRRAPRVGTEEAEQLAAAVEGLPLALDQIAGWLDGSTMSVAEYVRMVRDGEPVPLRTGGDYPMPYPAAFKAFAERLREHAKAGAELLRLCALFGPGPVPLALVRAVPVDQVSPAVAALLESPSQWELAVGRLVHASAVRMEADALHMHRFVREAIRRRTPDDQREKGARLVRSALAALDPGSPEDPSSWPRYAQLMPYVEASGVLPEGAERRLFLNYLTYLTLSGAHTAARRMAERTLDTQDAAVPDWELALRYTAALRASGDYSRAERLDRAVLGRLTDPDALAAMRALAADLRGLARYKEAYELSRRQFHMCLPFEDGEDYLHARADVAASLRALGRYTEALELEDNAAGNRRETLSLRTLASGTDYAWDLRLAGRYGRALDHQARTVQAHRERVGRDAPHTLRAEYVLAQCRLSCGQTESGTALLGETLARAQGLLGDDAPLALAIASGYACALRRDGSLERAGALSDSVADTYRAGLGAQHPHTIGASANRGLILLESGEADQARSVLEKALNEMTAALGEDHPWTLGIALGAAASSYHARDWAHACALSRETALRAGEALGRRHPLTLLAQLGLAADLRELPGGRSEARTIEQVAVGGLEATLGPTHAQVLAGWQRVRQLWDFEPLPV